MSDAAVQRDEAKRAFLSESAWMRYSSPLFSALSHACAADTDMLELGTETRQGQSAGMLLPMVAHYLLLKSPEPNLARYFASMVNSPEPAGDAFPAFREFCLNRREEVIQLLATRTVNTNLVERSSGILMALAHVGRLTREPMTVVEICCSAGLNLLFDQYHYDYDPAGSVGVDRSPVQLSCKLIGTAHPRIDFIPRVASRIGVDLVKMDTSDALERLWMEATIFPEWKAERKHLKAALSVRESHALEIVEGDALKVLPSVLTEVSGTACVLHTHCMGQWTAAARSELDGVLRIASRERDIHRIGIDRIYEDKPEAVRRRLAKLASAGVPLMQKSLPSRIEHTWYADSDAKTQLLGEADGCGAWIDWHPSSPDVTSH